MNRKINYSWIWFVLILLLSSCMNTEKETLIIETLASSSTPIVKDTNEIVNEIGPTPSPSLTPQPIPTQTLDLPEKVFTPTPTATQAVLILQPTPTTYIIMPGIYQTGGCAVTHLDDVTLVHFCVTSVEVKSNRNMVFNVTWQLKFTSNDRKPKFWTKRSDRGNQNMYLLDNLGQRYDHIRGGGAAYTREGVWGGDLHTGWFEFPPAPPGAITFYFYDDDLEQVIRNIPLIQPDVVFLEFPLANKDLIMEFPQDEWKIFETPEGKVSLANEKIPECRLNEKASELEGKTLNTMNLGSTTYQISSYNDSQTKDPVRDYQAVEIDGIIENLPVITLSLPDGDPQACIFAASKILASLSERQEVVIPTPILITPTTTPDPTLETAANNETISTATPAGPPTEVQPGYYPVNACDSVQHDKIKTATIQLCILNMIVYADRSVLANISLEVKNPYKWADRKKSDLGNAEVYLMDKKGNRYIQKAGSDLLYQEILIRAGERVDGWYKFPTIASDAFEISFFNDRQGFAISRIFLREPVILTGEFPLSNSQFELEYLHEDWELSESEGQSPILKNKKIEGCFFQEYLEKELKGKLKNTTVLGGNLVYKIYGYLDTSSNTGYREYQFAGGLPISDGSTYPTFLVTIPLEEQQKCIFDASELLGNLTIRQEE